MGIFRARPNRPNCSLQGGRGGGVDVVVVCVVVVVVLLLVLVVVVVVVTIMIVLVLSFTPNLFHSFHLHHPSPAFPSLPPSHLSRDTHASALVQVKLSLK